MESSNSMQGYKVFCRECGSNQIRVNNHPLAWFGGIKEFGMPNVEVYCFLCTSSYCVSLSELE